MESTMILTCNRRRKREVKDDQRSVPDDEEPERQPRKWKRDVEISLGLGWPVLIPTGRFARLHCSWIEAYGRDSRAVVIEYSQHNVTKAQLYFDVSILA
ncbi:hypothetical protein CRG98_045100 [Punica granatum]|uniref:Uncharacterized protein n=1 Tax=Punica granatum TaxID=22663 RepID=A0A2I0HSI8_PUNGR|nr:hypothetical protein CRG98_045100 [Punica granatum]